MLQNSLAGISGNCASRHQLCFLINQNIASVFLTRKFRITKKCGRDRRCSSLRRQRIALLSLDVIHNKGEFQPTPNKLEQTLTPNHGT
jgi:hypothetical protein